MSRVRKGWVAEIVHRPFPRPEVITTDDIHVETVCGQLKPLSGYFREHQHTISRITLYPPGLFWDDSLIDRVIE